MLTSAPFGMRPVFHPSGIMRARALDNGIASGYASSIFLGDPVRLTSTGQINVGTGSNSILGSFAGCEFVDTFGRYRMSSYWPANTTGTQVRAWFHDDPVLVYAIQANGPVAQAAVGDQANIVNPGTGNTSTGISAAALSSTLAGTGVQAILRIIDVYDDPNNAWGDAFTVVLTQIANHQYVNPIVAF